jgi:hypothetical protein
LRLLLLLLLLLVATRKRAARAGIKGGKSTRKGQMGWQRVAMTTIDGDDEEGRGQVGEVKGGVTVTVMSGLGKRPTFGGGGALSRGPKGHTVEASADVQLKQLLPAAACWNRRSASRPEADSNFASPNQ